MVSLGTCCSKMPLLKHQRELHRLFHRAKSRRFVARCARRFGKSYWCCTEASIQAYAVPNSQIRYAAPTAKMVRSIIEPHMNDILKGVKDELRPKYERMEGRYRFPNGSDIWVAGCDNGGYERLRGTSTHLGIVDEAGFVDELRKVVDDVLLPQTITTDGRILIASTPPRTPAHDFVGYDLEVMGTPAHVHRTIYDASHISEEQVEEYMAECGGEESSTWRREYLAEIVVDEEMAVIPEFGPNEHRVVEARERPTHFDTYVSIDFGFKDLTFAVFGYLDFENATVVVERCLTWRHTHSEVIARDSKAMEMELWGGKPYRRVADAPLQLIADLNRTHGFSIVPTRKDDKDAQLNALRLAVAGAGSYKLAVDPGCEQLIAHMRHAIWNKSKTSFDRSGDYGHFDGVDALLYLVRNVDFRKNPFPAYDEGVGWDSHHFSENLMDEKQSTKKVLRELFKNKRAS